MVTNNTYEYGIKYRLIKIDDIDYFMIPIGIVGGLSDKSIFCTNSGMFPIIVDGNDLKNKVVIDNIFDTEDLEKMYDYFEDTDFLADFFLNDFKDIYYYVSVDDNNIIKKYEIKKDNFKDTQHNMILEMDKEKPSLLLNQDIIDELLACTNIKDTKVILNKYKYLIKSFSFFNKQNKVTRVHIENNKIVSFDTENKIKNISQELDNNSIKVTSNNISFRGLKDAIKEKIIGHDEQIDTFAQKLYMNYTAEDQETVESILLVGPTGTGKTETVKAACDYLDLPYVIANSSNLVPQGIKGMSIEKLIKELYLKANEDVLRAQRGVVFLDEFDKIDDSGLDLKAPIKDILLSFTDGADIQIYDDDISFVFNSKMTNKIYAGVFERIMQKNKNLGFGIESKDVVLKDGEDIRQKIIDKNYYTLEEISRINRIIGFNELTREDKKKILLTSKLSEFAKKRARYKRQFNIDLIADEEYIDAILDNISSLATGMRSVNNIVKKSIDEAEKEILENEQKGYKKLILTKSTVLDSKKFDII